MATFHGLLNHLLISSVILTAFLINPAENIRCWHCNSNVDPKCGDPFDNSTLSMKNCAYEAALDHYPTVKATMCRKIRQKVNGNWRYYRDCAYLGEPGIGGDDRYCLMRTGTHNIFVEVCTCRHRDGCNKATNLELNIFILFVGSLLFAYMMTNS